MKNIIGDDIIRTSFMVVSLLLFSLLCIISYGLFHVRTFKKISSFFIGYIARMIRKTNKINQWIELSNIIIDDFNKSIWRISNDRIALFIAILCTIIYWLLFFSIPSFILLGLGSDPALVNSILAQIIITLIMIVPITPGSSGIAEISFISIYAAFVDSSILGILVVGWRLIVFHSTIILSSIVSLKILQKEELI